MPKERNAENQIELFDDKLQRWMRVTWPINVSKATMLAKVEELRTTGKMSSPFIKVQPI